MNFLADIFTSILTGVAKTSSSACMFWLWEEPKCPKALVK